MTTWSESSTELSPSKHQGATTATHLSDTIKKAEPLRLSRRQLMFQKALGNVKVAAGRRVQRTKPQPHNQKIRDTANPIRKMRERRRPSDKGRRSTALALASHPVTEPCLVVPAFSIVGVAAALLLVQTVATAKEVARSSRGIESSLNETFVLPAHILAFDRALEEATDLTEAYINAHNTNSTSLVDYDDDDNDELAKEIERLTRVEEELGQLLCMADIDSRENEDQYLFGVRRDPDGHTFGVEVEAMNAIFQAIFEMPSDSESGNEEESSSLEKTESSFNVEDARKAVDTVMQRLKNEIPANGLKTLANLEKIQSKMKGDLLLLNHTTSPTCNLGIEDAVCFDIGLSTSSVSELTLNEVLHASSTSSKKECMIAQDCKKPRTPKNQSGGNIASEGSPYHSAPALKTTINLVDTTRAINANTLTQIRPVQGDNLFSSPDESNNTLGSSKQSWRRCRTIWDSLLSSGRGIEVQNLATPLKHFVLANNDAVAESQSVDIHETSPDNNSTASLEEDETFSSWSKSPMIGAFGSEGDLESVVDENPTEVSSKQVNDRVLIDSRLSLYWKSLLNNEENSSSNKRPESPGKIEKNVNHPSSSSSGRSEIVAQDDQLQAAERIPEISTCDTANLRIIAEGTQQDCNLETEDGIGVEAFLLEEYLPPPPAGIVSDISGSTDAEYTDSESTHWSMSMASSSLEGIGVADIAATSSMDESHSLPVSAVEISLQQSISSTTEAPAGDRDPARHPLEKAWSRKKLLQQNNSANGNNFYNVTETWKLLLATWTCQPKAGGRRKTGGNQVEEQLLSRLKGIQYY